MKANINEKEHRNILLLMNESKFDRGMMNDFYYLTNHLNLHAKTKQFPLDLFLSIIKMYKPTRNLYLHVFF